MAALLGAELDQARAICAAAATDPETGKDEVVEVANDNGGGQVVISGAKRRGGPRHRAAPRQPA